MMPTFRPSGNAAGALRDELAKLKNEPTGIPNGTIVRFRIVEDWPEGRWPGSRVRYGRMRKSYLYAAVFIEGKGWYHTGNQNGFIPVGPLSHADFLNILKDSVQVKVATEFENVDGSLTVS